MRVMPVGTCSQLKCLSTLGFCGASLLIIPCFENATWAGKLMPKGHPAVPEYALMRMDLPEPLGSTCREKDRFLDSRASRRAFS